MDYNNNYNLIKITTVIHLKLHFDYNHNQRS